MENSTAAKIVKTIGIRNINRIFQVIRAIYMLVDYILTLSFGYSLVYGWKKDEKLAKKPRLHLEPDRELQITN